MGSVIIQEETTKDPISLIGREAGVCRDKDTSDKDSNYKRGIGCLEAGHGRTWEYPQVYMIIDGYSARVIRELYTHIAGGPTRLQASTRRIDYSNFRYVVPKSVANDREAYNYYNETMKRIASVCKLLEERCNVPREDVAMLLPLGMETKVVLRTNLRNLLDMCHQRMCSKAFWEYRQLMSDMAMALKEYSGEWRYIVKYYFVPKCELAGHCMEKHSCGRIPVAGECREV